MKRYYAHISILVLLCGVTGFIFRSYFLMGEVPFPSNLLVSYYQPWASYPDPEYPNGPPNKPMGFDNLRIHYPLKTLAVDELKKGHLPLWNPYAFSGNPLLASYQSAIFHPLSWLFLILPQIDAWSLIIMLQPVFAGFFMWLFLRSLKLSLWPCVFGSLSYALSGFFIVWWEEAYMSTYSAMSLPLILFGFEKIKQNKRIGLLSIVIGIVWSIMSGWFQMTLYAGLVVAARMLWQVKTLERSNILLIVAGCILGVLISGLHLVPSYEALMQAARGSTDAKYLFDGYLLQAQELVKFIAPDYFGNPAVYNYTGEGFYYERMGYFGVIPLVLAVFALSAIRIKDKESFWGYLLLLAVILAFKNPVSWFFLYTMKVPIISVLIPSRILYIAVFSGTVLASYGLEWAMFAKKKIHYIQAFGCIAILYAYIWYGILQNFSTASLVSTAIIQMRNMILPSGMAVICFAACAMKRFRPIFVGIIIGTTIVGSVYFAQKYLYFSKKVYVFPESLVLSELKNRTTGHERIWTFGDGAFESNIATQFHLMSPEGYDSIYIRRYGELVYASKYDGEYSHEIDRADATLASESRIDKLLDDLYRTKMIQILGVRYVAGFTALPKDIQPPLYPPDELIPVWNDHVYTIYEFTDAFPRAFFVDSYRVKQSNQDVLSDVLAPSTDLRRIAILEKNPDLKIGNCSGTEATIASYEPQSVTVRTACDTDGLLFLSDAYYPGWNAYVDGKKTEIYRADYAFRAVPVPQGNHEVIFIYEPKSVIYGMISSIIGCVGLFFVWKRFIH